MTKKIFTTILALLAIATTARAQTKFGIEVGGVQVTSANLSNITGGDIKSGTVKYNPTNKKLTLTNVKIERSGSGRRGIYNEKVGDLTIVFEGTNTITTDVSCALRCEAPTTLVLSANSTTTFTATKEVEAIYVTKGIELEIQGSDTGTGSLTVKANKEYAIEGDGKETIRFTKAPIVTLNGVQGNLVNLRNVIFNASSTAKTQVTLKAVGSAYSQVQNVTVWTEQGYSHIETPAGAKFDSTAKTIMLNGKKVANQDVVINEDVIPLDKATKISDANFRAYLKEKIAGGRNYLTYAEAQQVKEMDVNNKNIANLKGIEHFTALENLYCQGNPLKSLDVSKNTKLKGLYSFYNELTELDVSKNINLTNLTCYRNQISGDKMQALVENLPKVASGNFSVFKLDDEKEKNVITKSQVALAKSKGWKVWACEQTGDEYKWYEYAGTDPGIAINDTNFPDANFRSFVSGVTIDKDEDGYLSDTEIAKVTSIDVSSKNIANLKGIEHFTGLVELDCRNNQLTSLNVSGCTALTTLYCSANQLSSLNVSGCNALKKLNCRDNQLTALDVSNNTALTLLFCYNNQLSSLNVSGCNALTDLQCYNNQLSSLNVSGCTALTLLSCNDNQLSSLDVSNNTALIMLWCYGNKINKTNMQTLVNSLPTVSGGKFYVINTKDSKEENVITKAQVNIANGQGWTVYDNNGESAVEYEGSDPVTYELKLEPGLTIMTVSITMDFAALWMAAMADVFNVESSKETGAVFKSKKTGKTLMIAAEGIVWVSADVTPEDNVTFDIPAAGRAELIKEFGEDLLSDYDEVTLSFVALPEKKDLTLSFPKKENTLEELNISEGSMEGIALYALLYWEKLQSFEDEETDATVFANMSGKNLFEMIDDKIIVCDGVTSADNITYTITDKNREDFMKGMEMPFDIFTAYKTIQIKFEFGTTGIGAPLNGNGQRTNDSWYTIDGKKLQGEPTKKGVYIIKGKKVKR